MAKTLFKPITTFDVTIPVSWENEAASPVILESIEQYAQLLPKISETTSFESFTFILWSFGMENFIREASMSTSLDGSRYLDTAKLRENKLRWLLVKWTLKGPDGATEPLEHITVQGRKGVTDACMAKVLGLDSTLMFLVLGMVDKVLAGLLPPDALLSQADFEQLAKGEIPTRLKNTQTPVEGTPAPKV